MKNLNKSQKAAIAVFIELNEAVIVRADEMGYWLHMPSVCMSVNSIRMMQALSLDIRIYPKNEKLIRVLVTV